MGNILFANGAASTLLSGISDSATTIEVQAGDGAAFPEIVVDSGNFFYLALVSASTGNVEFVKCTAHTAASDTFTVVRGQDDSTAQAFLAGDRCELRMNAAAFEEFLPAGTYYSQAEADAKFCQPDADNDFSANQTFQGNVTVEGVHRVRNAAPSMHFRNAGDTLLAQLYHNGANFIIDNDTGDLILQKGGITRARTNGDPFNIYHAGSQKFGTYSAGVQMLQNTDNFDMQDGTIQFGTSWGNHSLGDHGVTGLTMSFQAGEGMGAGEFFWIATDGKAYGSHTMSAGAPRRIMGYTPNSTSAGNNFVGLICGIIQDTTWIQVSAGLTMVVQFGEVYAKSIASVGSASGTTYQQVGLGLTTDTFFFHPFGEVFEVM